MLQRRIKLLLACLDYLDAAQLAALREIALKRIFELERKAAKELENYT